MKHFDSTTLEHNVLDALTRSEQERAHLQKQASSLSSSALDVQHHASDGRAHRVAGEVYERARRVEADLDSL